MIRMISRTVVLLRPLVQNHLPRDRRLLVAGLLALLVGFCPWACTKKPAPYGKESQLRLPGDVEQVWAVAPVLNLSGQRGVDPLLQADLLFKELQSVRGIRAVPVNRTAEVYAGLRIDRIESPEQAQLVCQLLGADGLLVPTVTIYDPYDPPKMGVALQLFTRDGSVFSPRGVLSMDEVRQLARSARPVDVAGVPDPGAANFLQEADVFDASHGSVRASLAAYAHGRADPEGPAEPLRTYLLSMDRYAGFVYHELLGDLMQTIRSRTVTAAQADVR